MVINIYNLIKLIYCFYKIKVFIVFVIVVVGGRFRFFVGLLVIGVEGVFGVDFGLGVGVVGLV